MNDQLYQLIPEPAGDWQEGDWYVFHYESKYRVRPVPTYSGQLWRDLEKDETAIGKLTQDGDRLAVIGDKIVWQRSVTATHGPISENLSGGVESRHAGESLKTAYELIQAPRQGSRVELATSHEEQKLAPPRSGSSDPPTQKHLPPKGDQMIKRFKNIPKSILAALGWLFKGRCPVSSPPFTSGRCIKNAGHSGSHITWRWLLLLLVLFLPGCASLTGLIDDNGRWPDSEHHKEIK